MFSSSPHLAGQPPPAPPWPLCLDLRTRGLHSLRLSFSWSEIHAVSILSRPSVHSCLAKSLFLNPGVKSEDQSVLEPDACYFISGFCCFSSTCFVKCKVQARFMSLLQSSWPWQLSSRSFVNCSCMSESLSQFAEWSVWVYKYPCSQCHGSLVSHIECHLVF